MAIKYFIAATKKYLTILKAIASNSYQTGMEYRFNYMVRLLRIGLETFIAIVFIDTFFSHVDQIGSWNRESMILLYGIFNLYNPKW